MRRCALGLILIALTCFTNLAWGQPSELAQPPATIVLPAHDDAALHDVQFLGSKFGWAVGDHGVIWKTVDGGRTWALKHAGVNCALRSVQFLTDRIGWVVGGGTEPFTRQSYGVALATKDGGETWQPLNSRQLPPLNYVKFFGLEEGVAVGEASAMHPTGVVTTKDGGKTWLPLNGNRTVGWKTAHFLLPDAGALGGPHGEVKLVGGKRLLATQSGNLGRRTVQGIHIRQDHNGWMVGDGGLLRRTVNGGISWEPPPKQLPNTVRDFTDFRCVFAAGKHAWIGGSPGGVIWHTPDGGATWHKQFTGQTVPLNAIQFTTAMNGWAVGEMGVMLSTVDGGRTWKAIRGGGRRAALLGVLPRASRVSFPLLTKLSGEQGYRSAVWLPMRPEADSLKTSDGTHADRCLCEAVVKAGGCGAEFSWRYAAETPDLQHLRDQLLKDWNARAEGRFREKFLCELVARIRTWRPTVIVMESPSTDDAIAGVLQQAMEEAVKQAADATRFIEHQEQGGLSTWKVQRVFVRQPPGSAAQAAVDPHEYLARIGASAQLASSQAAARLWDLAPQSAQQEAYRVAYDRAGNPAGVGDFFSGIAIKPGSESRRELLAINLDQQDAKRALFRRQRNFQAYSEQMMTDPRKANQVLAQLRNLTEGMERAQAAQQLLLLAADYRRQSRFDLAEATLIELFVRYPRQPATHDGMRWLLQFWSSLEPAWQRSQATQVQGVQTQVDANAALERIQQAWQQAIARRDGTSSALEQATAGTPDPIKLVSHAGGLQVKGTQPWRSRAVRNWHDRAVHMASSIRTLSPAMYDSAEVQFPLASLMRQRELPQLSDQFYRRFEQSGDDAAWKGAAAAELWLNQPTVKAPKMLVSCKQTKSPPLLDGTLSDECWQAAKIASLKDPRDEAAGQARAGAFLMFSYDEHYLYYAANVPRSPDQKYEPVKLAGRRHDADLLGRDRLGLALDVDRDYTTWYSLTVDQRGHTADACWEDAAWNPKWHVKVVDDGKSWRIEAAIPLRELVPEAPYRGQIWALGVSRILPAQGRQNWPHTLPDLNHPAAFGLMRFE